MTTHIYIMVLYKYTTDLEVPTFWNYNEPFPVGWFWVKEDKINSEYIEYFQGIQSTKKEMLDYLQKKFQNFKEKNQILYYKFM